MRWRRALPLAGAIALLAAQTAHAASELSTSDRLQARREIAAGTRATVLGFADGRFYANGWHIHGEMGGVWTTPMKMLDGVWFGIDDQWVGPATKFTSGHGYVRYDLPDTGGLQLSRTDFVPDGRRAALFGLEMTNPGDAAKTVTVKVDAHSELIGHWPWGFDKNRGTPDATSNRQDNGAFDGSSLVFTDDGTLGDGAPEHHYAALVAADRKPAFGVAAAQDGKYFGPQPGNVCADGDGTSAPSACDDGPYGRGTGGELRYSVTVPAHGSQTLWVAAAGSDQGLDKARGELAGALRDPGGALEQKKAARAALSRRSRVSLPGDPLLQEAVEWGKQNIADSTQTAENLQIRWTDQGKQQFPPPLGTVGRITWMGAGFPDYPWMFATDGEYTAFAAVALGQFEAAEAHLRSLRDVSDVLNDRSGVVAHEVVPDGSVYFGHDSQRTQPDGTKTNDFNTDEIVKFPSTVAMIWRWTGDNRFRDEMYDFSKRNLLYVKNHLDANGDGWPEGTGNVERTGMGPEKLDNAVYYIRGLEDLADMARSKHDQATAKWAGGLAQDLESRFESTWWDPASQQYADSLATDGSRIFQKHWIGQTPMEAEVDGMGLAAAAHGTTALAGRENSEFSGDRPLNQGLFHTGRGGGADGKGDLEIFSLGTAIQAVGEGNYGRTGAGEARRYTDADAETMISEPANGGEPDEMPGAMPEILPSEGFGKNIDKCWGCRSMFMQAWGNYGTAWPVVHQQLGVSPDLGHGAVAVIPQVPDKQPGVEGSDVRLGRGSIDVGAFRSGKTYTTRVNARRTPGKRLTLGAVLPDGSRVKDVRLDGKPVRHYELQDTNRGVEVTVQSRAGDVHSLTVTAR